MTTLNFPTNPSIGIEYTFGSKTWVWNGTVWSLKQDSPVVLLDLIKTVDGTGSGLDADILDGKHASDFYPATAPVVLSVGAITPLVSSGGATPSISIPAANSTTNGYMSSAYASKLDGIATGATNVTNTNQLTNGAGYITSSGSITGSSGSVTGLTLTSSANGINPDSVTQNQIGYNTSVSLFGQTDGGLYSSTYSASWIHQIYGDFRTGQIAIRGKNSGTWQAWRTVLDSSNYSNYAMPLNGGINANFDIASSTNASDYTTAAIELRELNHAGAQGAAGGFQSIAPRLSFHWGGVVASQIAIQSDGAICIINNPGTGYEQLRSGAITSSGNVTAYSDESLKTDWNNLDVNFIEHLANTKSGTYTRIDTGERQAGSSAQDWQKLLPEVVSTGSEGILSLAYGNAALVSSIELAKRVVEQDKRIAELERLVSKLIGD